MLCPRCGLQNDDNNTYCTKCGARLNGTPDPVPEYMVEKEALSPEQIKAGKQILLWGILSLAVPGVVLMLLSYLSEFLSLTLTGLYLFLAAGAVMGIALAFICKTKVKSYRAAYGTLQGAARIGRGLSTAALCVNIATGVMFIFTLFTLGGTNLGNMTMDQLMSSDFLSELFGTAINPGTASTAVPTATPLPTATPVPAPGVLESL